MIILLRKSSNRWTTHFTVISILGLHTLNCLLKHQKLNAQSVKLFVPEGNHCWHLTEQTAHTTDLDIVHLTAQIAVSWYRCSINALYYQNNTTTTCAPRNSLTQGAKSIVQRDHDHVTESCHDASVVRISGATIVGFAMNEHDHRKRLLLRVRTSRRRSSRKIKWCRVVLIWNK